MYDRRIVLVFLAGSLHASCIHDNLVQCDNGMLCPSNQVCDIPHHSCTTEGQLDACIGKSQNELCAAPDAPDGVCREGVCLSRDCTNGYVDPGEACDDGNDISGDGCSSDCLSDERCGTGVRDLGEDCDDGNLTSHDGCDSRCLAETPAWTQLIQTANPRVSGAAVAYDEARGRLVVFGGDDTGKTREWNGRAWLERASQPAPSARSGAAMAYDAAHHQIVMFGGGTTTKFFDDTWIWDGKRWSKDSSSTKPTARIGHSMIYDAVRQRVLLFGGIGGTSYSQDAFWQWDGEKWSELHPGELPPARAFHAAAYDPQHGQMVVYGGFGVGGVSDETLLWDGSTWAPGPHGPPAKSFAAMSYSPILKAIVMTSNDGASSGDVWLWNGLGWSSAPSAQAVNRSSHASFFDPSRGETVIFGGSVNGSVTDTMSSYSDRSDPIERTWTALDGERPLPARLGLALAYDTARARVVLFGGFSGDSSEREVFELVGSTWQVVGGSTPPATRLLDSAMAYDERREVTVLFGGELFGGSFLANTVYEWNGSWLPRVSEQPRPAARAGNALAYDRARGVTVLFGGRDAAGYLDDTWLWNGDTWTRVTTGPSPPARSGHRLAYDTRRHKIVLFGGRGADGDLGDVWEWDGEWVLQPTAEVPRPRRDFGMTYDPLIGETIVHAGSSGTNDALGDTWLWNGTRWKYLAASGLDSTYHHALVYDAANGGSILVGPDGTWQLRWDSNTIDDACHAAIDLDLDGRSGCDDPDCWFACSPQCPPGLSCASGPTCGDHECSVLETTAMCQDDC